LLWRRIRPKRLWQNGPTTLMFEPANRREPATRLPSLDWCNQASKRMAFVMMGKSIPRAQSLGEIDIPSIAPTLAKVMKKRFRTAAQRQPESLCTAA
jgi:hypothetical protein